MGCRTYVVCRREAKCKGPLIMSLGRAKDDCPRDVESNAVIQEILSLLYKLSRLWFI